jgi:WXG100 family type VII secretion target
VSVSKFRGHYQNLNQIAQTFKQQGEAVQQMQQNLQSKMDTLRGGDWRGDSANKFYKEMDGKLLPAVQKLGKALDEAAQVTTKISKLVKQTEDDSAKIFVLVAAPSPTNPSPGSTAGAIIGGIAGAVAGAAVGGVVGAVAGGVAGAAAGSAIGSSVGGSSSGTGGTSGGSSAPASGGSSGGGGTTGGGGSATPPTTTATQRELSNLDPQVAAIAAQSPTLTRQLEQLERDGWTIQYGTPGGGSVTDQSSKTITIDPSDSVAVQVGSVAHEGAHALYGEPPYHAPTDAMTKNQYIQQNVDEQLKGEGNSMLNEATVQSEVKAAGGPDTGISGTQSATYSQLYRDYQAGTITRDQAIQRMGDAVGRDTTGNTHENYRVYYGKTYSDFWDANVAPGRRTP